MKYILEDIKEQCELEFEKVKKNVYYFEKARYQSEEMCLFVVNKQPEMLKWVERPTHEMCVSALNQDASLVTEIPAHLLDAVLKELGMVYLPKGTYNTPLLLQKQSDGSWVAKRFTYFNSKDGIEIAELLERLSPYEVNEDDPNKRLAKNWNLGIEIQRHFLKENGIIES